MEPGLSTITLAGVPIPASAVTTIGLVLLWTLAVVATVLLVLLVVPIHLRAEGGAHSSTLSGWATVRWGWGLVAVRVATDTGTTLHLLGIRLWTFRGTSTQKERDEPKEPAEKRRGRKVGLRWFLQYRRHAWWLARRLFGTLRLRGRLTGELGLGDPADTALLAALLGELDRSQRLVELRVQPDWLDETIELDGELRARIWLIHIGLILLWALLRRDTRRMLRAAW